MRAKFGAACHESVLKFSVAVPGAIAAVSPQGAAGRGHEDDEEQEGLGKFHGAHWNRIAES
jgi:hypothetical protein